MDSLYAASFLYGSNGQSQQGGVNMRRSFKIFSIDRRKYPFQTQRCHNELLEKVAAALGMTSGKYFKDVLFQ